MVHTTDLGAVISQVQTDGSLTTVMDDANIAGVYDLIEFAGSIYFIGGTDRATGFTNATPMVRQQPLRSPSVPLCPINSPLWRYPRAACISSDAR